MNAAWTVELLKVRRSPVTRTATGAMALIAPFFAVGGAALVSGGTAGSSPSADKIAAMIHGEGWAAVASGLSQVSAVLWLLGTGIMAAWCCGREYADRTLAQLLGLPTPVGRIALAKLGVVLACSWATALVAYALTVGAGLAVGFGVPTADDLAALGDGLLAAVASAWLALPFAWVATVGRGYLPAVGALLATVMVSQVVVLLGGGSWFPWAVPALLAVPGSGVGGIGVYLVVAVGALASWCTVRTWSRLQLT